MDDVERQINQLMTKIPEPCTRLERIVCAMIQGVGDRPFRDLLLIVDRAAALCDEINKVSALDPSTARDWDFSIKLETRSDANTRSDDPPRFIEAYAEFRNNLADDPSIHETFKAGWAAYGRAWTLPTFDPVSVLMDRHTFDRLLAGALAEAFRQANQPKDGKEIQMFARIVANEFDRVVNA